MTNTKMHYVSISQDDAHWLGYAPAHRGGWVWAGDTLEVCAWLGGCIASSTNRIACLPEDMLPEDCYHLSDDEVAELIQGMTDELRHWQEMCDKDPGCSDHRRVRNGFRAALDLFALDDTL